MDYESIIKITPIGDYTHISFHWTFSDHHITLGITPCFKSDFGWTYGVCEFDHKFHIVFPDEYSRMSKAVQNRLDLLSKKTLAWSKYLAATYDLDHKNKDEFTALITKWAIEGAPTPPADQLEAPTPTAKREITPLPSDRPVSLSLFFFFEDETEEPEPAKSATVPDSSAVGPTSTVHGPISDLQSYTQAVNNANLHNYRYFVLSNPTISDAEFDQLYFAIQDYEQQHPEHILPDSPTQSVGADGTDSKRTVPHRYLMLSTEKGKTTEAVQKWMQKTTKNCGCTTYTAEWKYDGCSCSLVYQDGELIEASTRGDTKQQKGQDILQHVKQIKSIPQMLYLGRRNDSGEWVRSGGLVPGRVEVRGEIIMPFSKLRDTNGAYADVRTASSAIINTDSVTPYDHLLEFIAYQLIGNDARWKCFHDENMQHLVALDCLQDALGFYVGPDHEEEVTLEEVPTIIKNFTKYRSTLAFPTDGIVFKVNDRTKWAALGHTDHHCKYAFAYKFPPKTAETIVTNIEITTGATGKRTPVCHFEPVTINGKTYTKASVGSEAVLNTLRIKVGSHIELALANDVIPHINRVLD